MTSEVGRQGPEIAPAGVPRVGRSDTQREGSTRGPSLSEVIRGVQRGDREAWELLYERYGHRVARLVRHALGRRLRGKLETADLVQSSFLEVFEHLPGFTYQGEAAFIAWLRGIVENKIRSVARYWSSLARSPGREEPVDLEALTGPGPSPSWEVRRREGYERLSQAVNRLPRWQRCVFVERAMLALPWETIARAHGRSLPAVQMLLVRAKKALARELERLDLEA